MRKLRVALVILLLLTFIAASQTVSASTTMKGMGDALSIGKSRASLEEIQKKLSVGNSFIANQHDGLSAYAKYMAMKNLGNVKAIKTGDALKPPSTKGLGVPLSGIGDAIKALGSIDMKVGSPASIAKSIKSPMLVVT